ncbi:PREDICTED: uncharacterized protein LOC105563955, partial [Vollenhovia emeryi]|uniref:uncharacterized protein LOC105563955 n=1 Tax=Vollenhovia emeryi TaxID=411798 RepID=UPI0005F55B4F
MPFGLKNAPATFQRLMDLVLSGLQGKELFVYMDDIVIYASSLEEHERKYNLLIDRLREANLKLQPDKCEFLSTKVTYLGHVISNDGVKPDPKKLEAVQQFPRPKTPKNIKQFLGLAGYYRRFIPNFSKLAKPLTNLLKNDTRFEWTQEESFDILKQKLCEEPVLRYPDFSKSFILTTDASGIAVGGILSQGEINKDKPIAYASRTLTDSELKYDTYEKEALAIVYCVKHFRPYLYGRKFTLVTDHKPLLWFKNAQDANMRILRWRLKLAEYEYDVVYKAGITNVNADALSRNPVDFEEADCNTIHHKNLNPNDPKDAEKIAQMLEESEDDEEDEDFNFHLSDDDEEIEDLPFDDDSHEDNSNSIPLTHEEILEPETHVETLVHNPPESHGMVTRSQVTKNRNNPPSESLKNSLTQKHENGEDSPDILNNTKGNEEDNERDSEEIEVNIEDDSNQKPQEKPTIVDIQTTNSNVIETRDLLFLRKDNVAYFVDTNGTPLDSGSQKLFERNDIPSLNALILGKAKAIKHKKYHHMVLPVSEGLREGPTMTLTHVDTVIRDLRKTADQLKLETVGIAKTDSINNVPWSNIKPLLRLNFIDSETKLIICNGLIKYPPKDLRSVIISEMHCSPVGGHRGVTKTYNRIKHKYYWKNLKSDVQRYIQQCLQCLLKKLVRVKTKQPMIITDTPGSSFDKVAMDI